MNSFCFIVLFLLNGLKAISQAKCVGDSCNKHVGARGLQGSVRQMPAVSGVQSPPFSLLQAVPLGPSPCP